MKWISEPVEGVFLKRYKRFFADVQLGQEVVVAHVANTGSLKSCLRPGAKALLTPATNPERKLRFTLEALQAPNGSWVGVNTQVPNPLVKQAFEQGLISDWKQFDQFQPEVKISKETRLDGVLLKAGKPIRYIEIKNVSLAVGDFEKGQGEAAFPDAVTERGQKHLEELMALTKKGFEAELIFTIQRTDCQRFRAASEIDPRYAELLEKAQKSGVIVRPLVVEVGPQGYKINLTHKLKM